MPPARTGVTSAGDPSGSHPLAALRRAGGLRAGGSPTGGGRAAGPLQSKRDLYGGGGCDHHEPPARRHARQRPSAPWRGRDAPCECRERLAASDGRPWPARRADRSTRSGQNPRPAARLGTLTWNESIGLRHYIVISRRQHLDIVKAVRMHPGRSCLRYRGYLEDGGIHDTEDRSVLHGGLGALLRWYREAAPGPGGSLSSATGGFNPPECVEWVGEPAPGYP